MGRAVKTALWLLPALLVFGQGGYTVLDGEIQPGGIPGFGGAGGTVASVVAGSQATVDNTDPQNPVVAAQGALDSDNINWRFGTGVEFQGPVTFNIDDFTVGDYEFAPNDKWSFTGTSAFTADRTFTLPDQDGTLATLGSFSSVLAWEAKGGVGSLATLEGPGALNASSDYSILAGQTNYINSTGNFNAIFGGGGATEPNGIESGSYNIIMGGANNIYGAGAGSNNFLGGGRGNSITGAGTDYNVLLGGYTNQISAGVSYSTLGGGYANVISGTTSHSFLGGGKDNLLTSSSWSVLGGGLDNLVSGSDYSAIAGGRGNEISGSSHYSTIGGGYLNLINNAAEYAAIPGGRENEVTEDYGVAIGYKSQVNSVGAFVFSDSDSTATVDGGADSLTMNYSGGLDIVAVVPTGDLPAPAAGDVTLFCIQTGTSPNFTYDIAFLFSDGQTNIVATHTIP